jgi:peptide/nickel transport system ATP-binding protein
MIGNPPLLQARSLSKRFTVGTRLSARGVRTVHAVEDVSLEVRKGETLGLVGESGCGKSTLGRCLVRLYDLSAGELTFEGIDISRKSLGDLRPLRQRMQMVFQDSFASLNPRRRVGDIVAEPLRVHHADWSGKRTTERVRELIELVGLAPEHVERFPHEFSGGQRQRIGIARALALAPSLIVADEPVSALDVSVQAQIINLMSDLQERMGLTYIFIAHDLSVVRQVSNRIAVMYLGSIVETGETDRIFKAPAHPYTRALISAVPVADVTSAGRPQRIVLRGDVPSPLAPPSGCRFHTRCPIAQERCRGEPPRLVPVAEAQSAACHFPLAPASAEQVGRAPVAT